MLVWEDRPARISVRYLTICFINIFLFNKKE